MPVRKWYEEILVKIDDVNKALDKSNDIYKPGQALQDKFDVMFKKAEKLAGNEATMADLKTHVAEYKSIKKDYEKWRAQSVSYRKGILATLDEIDALAKKIGDRMGEMVKDEMAHIQKHRQRIADAKKRALSLVEAKLNIEETKADKAAKAKNSSKIEDQFSRADRRDELVKNLKLTDDEKEAIKAAEKRIDVYDKIRAKKVQKYDAIRKALLDYQNDFKLDKIM